MKSSPEVLRRAKPLLGTFVAIHAVADDGNDEHFACAIEAAFEAIEAVDRAMSAHRSDSDLARLAHARRGVAVELSPHTCAVLRAAQHWARESSGAFDPVRAGLLLSQRGVRPGVANQSRGGRSLAALQFLGESKVLVEGPLTLDLGGIAKGYAVDRAIETLRACGVKSALVNAGGDLRAFGNRAWAIDIRHPSSTPYTRRLLQLKDGAIATSVPGNEFVPRRRARACWQCATVQAHDCMTADALTKWALQAGEPALGLRRTLRERGARMLRW